MWMLAAVNCNWWNSIRLLLWPHWRILYEAVPYVMTYSAFKIANKWLQCHECVSNLTNLYLLLYITFSSIFAHRHVMWQPPQDPSLSWAVMTDVSYGGMPTLPEQLVSPRNIPRCSQQFSRELPILQALHVFLTEMWRGMFSVLTFHAVSISSFSDYMYTNRQIVNQDYADNYYETPQQRKK